MKKSLFILAFMALFLVACDSEVVEEVAEEVEVVVEEDVTELPSDNFVSDVEHSNFELVRIAGSGSCFDYKIVDLSGREADIPQEVKNALTCSIVTMSPSGKFVLYTDGLYLKTYHFGTRTVNDLMSFLNTNEGLSGFNWDNDGNRVAVVSTDQQTYDTNTKIFVLGFGDVAELVSKDRYNKRVQFSCGSICGTDDALRFIGEDRLEYTGENEERDPIGRQTLWL